MIPYSNLETHLVDLVWPDSIHRSPTLSFRSKPLSCHKRFMFIIIFNFVGLFEQMLWLIGPDYSSLDKLEQNLSFSITSFVYVKLLYNSTISTKLNSWINREITKNSFDLSPGSKTSVLDVLTLYDIYRWFEGRSLLLTYV